MKFYLTKKAQRLAEGLAAPKVHKQTAAGRDAVARSSSDPALEAKSVPAVPQPRATGKPISKASQRASKSAVVLGGIPRVDLLPLEVRAERRGTRNVRRAWLGVIGVAVLAGIASGAATLSSLQAQSDLASTQGETASLSAEQAKYSKVRVIENQTSLIDAARKVGGSTDIDWDGYLTKLQAALPSGTAIKSVNVDSSSPITSYTQSTAALQGVRVGTVTVTVSSPTLPSVPKLLLGLVSLPGYVDATPGTVTADAGAYTAVIVIHINEHAYSGLYTKKGQ